MKHMPLQTFLNRKYITQIAPVWTVVWVPFKQILILFFIVPNHALHYTFKTLKSHTKTLKIRPYMFQSSLKPSSGGPWLYFATLLSWNVDLHSL
jgi:hypothetical protein